MLKCGARVVGPAAFFVALAMFLTSAAHGGEIVKRRGAFQSKMGTAEAKTCGSFVWLIADTNDNGRKDAGEKWVFRVEDCPEVDALFDMGNPPDPQCGDGTANTGEQCGEPGLAACSTGFRCNTACQCEAIPNPDDPTGKCKDGTPDLNAVGHHVVDSVFINKGEFVSYCVQVPAGAVSVSASTKNLASVTCGNFSMVLRHTDTTLYPAVKAEGQGTAPNTTLTTLGGSCGYFPPGCPSKVPPGTYEARITGNADECTRLGVSISIR